MIRRKSSSSITLPQFVFDILQMNSIMSYINILIDTGFTLRNTCVHDVGKSSRKVLPGFILINILLYKLPLFSEVTSGVPQASQCTVLYMYVT